MPHTHTMLVSPGHAQGISSRLGSRTRPCLDTRFSYRSDAAAAVLSIDTHLAWRRVWENLLEGMIHKSGCSECLAAGSLARHHDDAVSACHGLLQAGGCCRCTSYRSLQSRNMLSSQTGYLLALTRQTGLPRRAKRHKALSNMRVQRCWQNTMIAGYCI